MVICISYSPQSTLSPLSVLFQSSQHLEHTAQFKATSVVEKECDCVQHASPETTNTVKSLCQ